MSRHRQHGGSTILVLVFASSLACSTNNGGGTGMGGSGGTIGSGGTSASGGTDQSGGSTGSGGTSITGGTTGTGGVTASGGVISSGGTSAAGGNSVRGGATGSGGSFATGGTPSTGGSKATGGASGTGTAGSTGSGAGGKGGTGGTSAAGGRGGSGGATTGGGTTGAGGTSASGGSTGSGDCTDSSTTTKSFTKQYEDGSLAVTGSSKTYYTMTNWWHKFGGQTVTLNGLSMKIGNAQNTAVPASDGNPMGFPSIFIGTYQNKATVGSNLPKKVSDLKSVPTIFKTNASSLDTSNLNTTYDVWFTATSAPLSGATANNPGKGGAYLMVWLFKPDARRPRGGAPQATGDNLPNFTAQTVAGVPGTWDVWIDKTDPLCISYVASDPIDELSYDLNAFIQDSVSNQYGITTSMYLSIVFAGTEIWSGGDGLEIKQFCAAVN